MRITEEGMGRDELRKLAKTHVCAVCGGKLDLFMDWAGPPVYLACTDDKKHEGTVKLYEPSITEENTYKGGVLRMVQIEKEHGIEKARALAKYQGVITLSRPQAMEILQTIWPEAPERDRTAAALLCISYGLNPLAGHVFLIGYTDKKTGKKTYARVTGIKANRLIASRKGSFGYVDDTPRLMTKDEQERVFGECRENFVTVIVKVRDMATGAEAPGYGFWPKDIEPKGTEKGNTKFNMAGIRAERQALDRLRPGEMPGVPAVDEAYVEGEYQAVADTPEEVESMSPDEPDVLFEEPKAGGIDMEWLKEQLAILQGAKLKAWTNKAILERLNATLKVNCVTPGEALGRLSPEQSEQFANSVKEAVEMCG